MSIGFSTWNVTAGMNMGKRFAKIENCERKRAHQLANTFATLAQTFPRRRVVNPRNPLVDITRKSVTYELGEHIVFV